MRKNAGTLLIFIAAAGAGLLAWYFPRWTASRISASPDAPPAAAKEENGLTLLAGRGHWREQTDVHKDLRAVAFNSGGERGAALALDGSIYLSRDGGAQWENTGTALAAPLTEGEAAYALAWADDDRLVVGSGVDESPFAALYEARLDYRGTYQGWERKEFPDLGGIWTAAADGSALAGGASLVMIRRGVEYEEGSALTQQVNDYEPLMLYGVARSALGRLVAVGDQGFLIAQPGERAIDPHSWAASKLSDDPLYSITCRPAEDLCVVGGVGRIWLFRPESGETTAVGGFAAGVQITALASDDREVIAGGATAGGTPFIFSSRDGGHTWRMENLPARVEGRIVSLARSRLGFVAVADDGHLLLREIDAE